MLYQEDEWLDEDDLSRVVQMTDRLLVIATAALVLCIAFIITS